jgi:hypothetical protein
MREVIIAEAAPLEKPSAIKIAGPNYGPCIATP